MSEERKQTEAILVAGAVICLWLSSFVPIGWWDCPGNYNLQKILRFWNKPLWINWPVAVALFIFGTVMGKKLQREITAQQIQKQQKEAQLLVGKVDNTPLCTEFKEIL